MSQNRAGRGFPPPRGIKTAGEHLRAVLDRLKSSLPSPDEIERAEREQAEAEAREDQAARRQLWQSFCPPLYRLPEIVAAMRERVPARVLQAALDWRPSSTRSGLLLHGETGGFKSTILFQIARRLILEEGERRVALLRGDTLGRDAAAAYGDPAKTAAWLDPFKRARWL